MFFFLFYLSVYAYFKKKKKNLDLSETAGKAGSLSMFLKRLRKLSTDNRIQHYLFVKTQTSRFRFLTVKEEMSSCSFLQVILDTLKVVDSALNPEKVVLCAVVAVLQITSTYLGVIYYLNSK